MNYFIFDLDDTLYLRSDVFVRTCIQTFPESAQWDPEKLYLTRKKYSDISYDQQTSGQMTKEDMYIFRTAETFREYGISMTDAQALAFENLYTQLQGDIQLHPVMEHCLQLLKEHDIPMAVITNGQSKRQRNKLHALSLERYIPETHWIVSEEAGAEKPDPEIFHFAAKKLDIPEKNAWFIGDAFEADIVGAAKAGWHTIWLNHRKEMAEHAVSPDYVLMSFDKVPRLFCEICTNLR